MPRGRTLKAATLDHDSLPDIQPVGAGDWIRLMLYSFPGWGKSSCWGTAALAGQRVLIIRSSLDNMPARIMQSGADQFVADTWEKMYEVLDYARMANHGYDWMVWDNVSIHEDVLLDDIWQGTIAAKPGRWFQVDDMGRSTGKPNLTPSSGLDRGEYGRNMERIQQWVRHMVGCNSFHFAIGAHPHEGPHPTNDEGGDLLRPYVQGKQMTEKLAGYCNMVGFLEVVEEDDKFRRIHFAENSRFYAKDLYDAFPDGFMEVRSDTPTLPNLMKAVTKARGRGLGNQASASRARGTTTTPRGRGRR